MFTNNADFYPTPDHLIEKMLKGIKMRKLGSVLEPSAGKGNIAKALKEKFNRICRYSKLDLDVIEVDPNLRHILKGESFKVVHDDFLTFHTYKSYDLIIMNPPFSNGDRHLLKALEMQERGGRVVCLLNAETLRNPYSNTRKALVRKLEEYDASVEFLEDAFTDAERKTGVEVALIKVKVPFKKQSIILEGLKREENYYSFDLDEEAVNQLAPREFVDYIVARYNATVKAGKTAIEAVRDFKTELSDAGKFLKLVVNGDEKCRTATEMTNKFVEAVRSEYWNKLFSSEQFTRLFTSKLRMAYQDKIRELVSYDFSLFNIYNIQAELSEGLLKGVEDTIIELFDDLSHKHYYYDETSNNIHYYNGWKTNKSWKINKKVIIPLDAYGRYDKEYNCNDYQVRDRLSDIEKALSYLDGGIIDHCDMFEILKEEQEKFRNSPPGTRPTPIQLKYFTVQFYKKGTCHIRFTNQELLDKFNLYGSQKKGWLPPTYGKKEYEDMTAEEQQVIDEFQGKDAYDKVLKEKEYYLAEQTPFSLGLPELPELPTPAATYDEEPISPVVEDSELMIEQKDTERTLEIIEHPAIIEVQAEEAIPAEVIEVIEPDQSNSSIVIDVEPEMVCESFEVNPVTANISEEMNDNPFKEETVIDVSSVEVESVILTEEVQTLEQGNALESEQLLLF